MAVASVATGITPAGAVDPVSQASAQWLSGSIAGTDVATLVSLEPTTVQNTGGQAASEDDEFNPTTWLALALPLGNILSNDVVTVGGEAARQFAAARPDGSAHAGAGAVDSDGQIGDPDADDVPDADVLMALGDLTGPVLLVDDLADTGWTITVAAKLLREAGAPAVLPLVIAVRS